MAFQKRRVKAAAREVAVTVLPARKCENWNAFGARVTCAAAFASKGREDYCSHTVSAPCAETPRKTSKRYGRPAVRRPIL
jgi:hypothetical protein